MESTKNTNMKGSVLFYIRFKYHSFNPLTTNVPHHIETSQLICGTNQLICFYMIGNIGR